MKLSAEVQAEEPLWVRGEEEQLYRLVANLINNALHYTPAGGKVNITLKTNKQQAIIKVQDTGIGITPAEQARIFDRFYRVVRPALDNKGERA